MAPVSLIGLVGAKGSGKTTVADWLVSHHGFVNVGFADALKTEVIRCFPRLLALEAQYWHGDAIAEGLTTLERAIEQLVWVQKPERVRLLLQEFGTEVRRSDDPGYWVRRWLASARPLLQSQKQIVVPDIRFRNEVRIVTELRGILVNLTRPGYEGDSHQSERDLDGWNEWDRTIQNTGTLEDLHIQADRLIVEV